MPRRHGNLYETCTSEEALWRGYYRARRGKRATFAVQNFERDLGANIVRLAEELRDGTYLPSPYRTFWVHEPKARMIYAPAFRDRIVQHAIYENIYPIFDLGCIDQTYACRIGKGTHRAADQAQRYLRQCEPDSYTLKMDIRKFFYRIDRDILRRQIERKIKDRRLVELMMRFADSPEERGIPIGNLLSQLYALVYLTPLDHFIKREIKAKRYVRYVDDFVIFGLSRPEAEATLDRIRDWLWRELGLEFSKWTIQPVRRGVNFVGYRTWRRTRFVRKHSLHKFSVRVRQGDDAAIRSLLAHAQATGSHRGMMQKLRSERPALAATLPETLR